MAVRLYVLVLLIQLTPGRSQMIPESTSDEHNSAINDTDSNDQPEVAKTTGLTNKQSTETSSDSSVDETQKSNSTTTVNSQENNANNTSIPETIVSIATTTTTVEMSDKLSTEIPLNTTHGSSTGIDSSVTSVNISQTLANINVTTAEGTSPAQSMTTAMPEQSSISNSPSIEGAGETSSKETGETNGKETGEGSDGGGDTASLSVFSRWWVSSSVCSSR